MSRVLKVTLPEPWGGSFEAAVGDRDALAVLELFVTAAYHTLRSERANIERVLKETRLHGFFPRALEPLRQRLVVVETEISKLGCLLDEVDESMRRSK